MVVVGTNFNCQTKLNNICIYSQTGPWENLVHVAMPTLTVCARGYRHAHKTLILVHISVRVAKSRARIVYAKTLPGSVKMTAQMLSVPANM